MISYIKIFDRFDDRVVTPFGPYYKSKLELKSNSSEILPVNC